MRLSMKKLVALFVAMSIIAPSLVASRRRVVQMPPGPVETSYLVAARHTAAWLATMERPVTTGIAWAASDRNPATPAGLGPGASGIGLFFLRLYEVTGEVAYLDKARGAADYVASEYRRGRSSGFDWQAGAIGGGEFFVMMYRVTGEKRYLDDARSTAALLLTQATRDATGTYWQFPNSTAIYPGIAHGAAGGGVFFLHLYELTTEQQYLDIALDCYKWMMGHTVPIGSDAVGWKQVTRDEAAYHGLCGGASGIVYFLDELHRATGDDRYLRDLERAADGLVHSAQQIGDDEASWRYTTSSVSSPPVIYCHGTAGASVALAFAASRTGRSHFVDFAQRGARRLFAIATKADGDGPAWPHIENTPMFETGFQTGAASVGHTFLRLHATLGDRHYLEEAARVGDYLLRIGDRPRPAQMRWINYTVRPPVEGYDLEYQTGWYKGAAGIGLFLLELHEQMIGRPAADRFSPVNP